MKIAVYCGSGSGNKEEYIRTAEELGRCIGENGHTPVYGGSNTGLMGTVADAVLAHGGRVTGVIPDVPLIRSRMHQGLTEIIETDSMAERKTKMIELADGFAALPGGVGTLDEITEILSLQSLDIIDAPIVFINTLDYYLPVKQFIGNILANEFGREEYFEKVLFSDKIEEIGQFMERAAK